VIVQCLRSDSSCFGHYNRSCLLAISQSKDFLRGISSGTTARSIGDSQLMSSK